MSPRAEFSRLLVESRDGDAALHERLYELVYQDLRRIARAHLRGQQTGTLGTPAMVNEAYLKLAAVEKNAWNDHAHFLSIASRAMRQILVDHARRKLAAKRGGGRANVTLDEESAGFEPLELEVLALDQALHRLQALSDRLARVTERTVKRDWRKARSLLHTWLKDPEGRAD